MFEQSLYEQEPAAVPTSGGDLFHNYEIKNWDLSPRIYKILGVAALANIFALFVFAQTSLLTMKGCDSPLVGRVCQVLDTVYVGAMLWGTDREYIDAVYDKTELGDAEITFVDVTGVAPPLFYPEGYFQIANPADYVATLDQPGKTGYSTGIPGIPDGIPFSPSTGGGLLDTAPNFPTPNPNPVDGGLPPGFGGNVTRGNPSIPRRKGPRAGRPTAPRETPGVIAEASPAGTPEPDEVAGVNPTPAPTVEPTGPVTDVEINKRPFIDLSNFINEKQINPETVFLVSATGKPDKTGKLDPKTFRFIKAESPDPKMIEVVKEAIEAMNESGYLQYLSLLSGKDLSFQVLQDNQNVAALVQSEFENDLRAKTVSSLLNAFIEGKREDKRKPEADQNDKDDLVLLQNATATANGKKIAITFNIPKADLQKMIQRKLAEQKAQQKQPNGNAVAKPADNAARN